MPNLALLWQSRDARLMTRGGVSVPNLGPLRRSRNDVTLLELCQEGTRNKFVCDTV